ncbi:MAG: FAD-dependent oxidoreductase [Rubricoccaceae bacterium]|nr:FAD-dependent oxidoreductase [Rubricoccaceae bacterium]
MPEHRVASVHDLAEGEMKQVAAGGTDVLLSRLGGGFHACGARCTHYGAPLAEGVLHDGCVVCPWHHARFDVRTGALADPPALDALPRYAVRVEGADVYVTVPSDAEETPEGASYRESGGHPPAHAAEVTDDRLFAIVGAGAAGGVAAETLRAAGFGGRIVMITQEDERPYDRTALSKGLLGGEVGDEALPLRDDAFYRRLGVEAWVGRRVTRLDAAAREIHFADGSSLRYDRALVATGGAPRRLDVPGADADGVFTLRSHADARRIVQAAKAGQRAVVVGSSFIGMEAAAQLRQRGLDVTVVSHDRVPFEVVLGEAVGQMLREAHEAQGVRFHLEAGVERIEPANGRLRVRLSGGTAADADLVLVGIGVTPATDVLEGVERHEDGGVLVDAHLRAAEGLWAAGDIVHVPSPQTGERLRIEHWRVAQQHGRVAAFGMAGREAVYDGVPFFWSGQFDVRPRYLGHAEAWDEVVLDGDLDTGDAIAYYVRGDRVLAACGIGRDRAMAALHALMLAGETPTAADVRAGFDPLAAVGAGAS